MRKPPRRRYLKQPNPTPDDAGKRVEAAAVANPPDAEPTACAAGVVAPILGWSLVKDTTEAQVLLEQGKSIYCIFNGGRGFRVSERTPMLMLAEWCEKRLLWAAERPVI